MEMIVLDTNAIVNYFKGNNHTVTFLDNLRNLGSKFVISTITEIELFSYTEQTSEEFIFMSLWMQSVFIVPVDSFIARKAADFRKVYRLETPDAIIAATCFVYGKKLVSYDRDMRKVKEIEIINTP